MIQVVPFFHSLCLCVDWARPLEGPVISFSEAKRTIQRPIVSHFYFSYLVIVGWCIFLWYHLFCGLFCFDTCLQTIQRLASSTVANSTNANPLDAPNNCKRSKHKIRYQFIQQTVILGESNKLEKTSFWFQSTYIFLSITH